MTYHQPPTHLYIHMHRGYDTYTPHRSVVYHDYNHNSNTAAARYVGRLDRWIGWMTPLMGGEMASGVHTAQSTPFHQSINQHLTNQATNQHKLQLLVPQALRAAARARPPQSHVRCVFGGVAFLIVYAHVFRVRIFKNQHHQQTPQTTASRPKPPYHAGYDDAPVKRNTTEAHALMGLWDLGTRRSLDQLIEFTGVDTRKKEVRACVGVGG